MNKKWLAVVAAMAVAASSVGCQEKGNASLVVVGTTVMGFGAPTDLVIPDGVTVINNRAFEGCTTLRDVSIPDGVTDINNRAFCGCKSLTSVNIPDSGSSSSAFIVVCPLLIKPIFRWSMDR